MSTHKETLNNKRDQERKKEKEDSPNEKREVVINGATLKCPYCSSPGELKVTSNEIHVQDVICATEGDNNGSVNLVFSEKCLHPKFGSNKPMCKAVMKLSDWQDVGTGVYQDQKVLIKGSTIYCDPTPNTPNQKPIPHEDRIEAPFD